MNLVTHLGAKKNTMTRAAAMSMDPYTKKPGDKNSFWNAVICPMDASWGPVARV